jgi:hypothetical protein
MRNIKQFSGIIGNPQLRRQKLVRLGTLASQKAASYRHDAEDGIAVMGQEWDNLLILDACRYDLFEAHHDFSGRLSKVHSRGSQSREFMEHNFTDQYHDTVYISANPFISFLDDDMFHATISLYGEKWDEEISTVRPESVVEATVRAHQEYPNKRLISHFMQPHHPFIGPTGQQFDTGGVKDPTREPGTNPRELTPPIWIRLNQGDTAVDLETVWKAYVENFELVSEHANELVAALDGKSVITSDHGNLFGERLWPIPVRKFGHPPGIRAPELVDVPWFELPYDERQTVRSDPPVERDSAETTVVEERLKDLGYV